MTDRFEVAISTSAQEDVRAIVEHVEAAAGGGPAADVYDHLIAAARSLSTHPGNQGSGRLSGLRSSLG